MASASAAYATEKLTNMMKEPSVNTKTPGAQSNGADRKTYTGGITTQEYASHLISNTVNAGIMSAYNMARYDMSWSQASTTTGFYSGMNYSASDLGGFTGSLAMGHMAYLANKKNTQIATDAALKEMGHETDSEGNPLGKDPLSKVENFLAGMYESICGSFSRLKGLGESVGNLLGGKGFRTDSEVEQRKAELLAEYNRVKDMTLLAGNGDANMSNAAEAAIDKERIIRELGELDEKAAKDAYATSPEGKAEAAVLESKNKSDGTASEALQEIGFMKGTNFKKLTGRLGSAYEKESGEVEQMILDANGGITAEEMQAKMNRGESINIPESIKFTAQVQSAYNTEQQAAKNNAATAQIKQETAKPEESGINWTGIGKKAGLAYLLTTPFTLVPTLEVMALKKVYDFFTSNDDGKVGGEKVNLNKYEEVVTAEMDREDVQKGYPDALGNTNTTWCNRFVFRVLMSMGTDIDPYLQKNPKGVPDTEWTSADHFYDNLNNAVLQNNSKIVMVESGEMAQNYANSGKLVIVSEVGHVGLVYPDTNKYNQAKGPLVAQQGASAGIKYQNRCFHNSSNTRLKYFMIK